jgi:hypothetical protein
MNKAFTTLIIASLGTILFSISAHAGSLAFDAAGNLFQAEFPEIVKFTPDGKRSPFAGISRPIGRMCSPYLAFDDKGNLFVSVCNTISKFTPDGKKSTFATGIKYSGDLVFDDKGNLFVVTGAVRFSNSPPMERGALSPPASTTRKAWLLTIRAISRCLWRKTRATRSSNSHPKE